MQTLMDKGTKLSVSMSLKTPEEKLAMKDTPYCKLVSKLLYLAVATWLDITYAVVSYTRWFTFPALQPL